MRRFACTAMALLSMAAIAFSAQAQSASAVPAPGNDPFYVPPAGYQSQPNGSVLASRTIDAQYLLPFLSTSVLSQFGSAGLAFAPKFQELKNLQINAYQVLYKSTDGKGQPVAEAATILVPHGPWTGGGTRPVITYQISEDSISANCEPSYTLRTGLLAQMGGAGAIGQFEVSLSLLSLLEGYAVVYPDYEGPQSEWIAGLQEAHAVLDGTRAALNYSPDGLKPGTQVGLWGYSGGGGATGWAAEQAQSYAPELHIVGANPNADLVRMYNNNDGSLLDGFLAMAFVSLNRAFPEAGIAQYFNAAGQQVLAKASNPDVCSIQEILQFVVAGKFENYTIDPKVDLTDSAPGKIIFPANALVDQPLTPSMPVLNYHDEFDELVPVAGDDELALKYCAAGGQVEVMRTSTPVPFIGLVHIAGEIEGDVAALNYLSKRFQGAAPRNDCPTSALWSQGNGLPYYAYITQ